jgi:hypothetical protein
MIMGTEHCNTNMKKSKKIVLTLLSAIALGTCGGEEHKPNPYDEYSWAGTSRDTGMSYTHYENGFLRYYLISRMFDGFGYNRYRGGGMGFVPGVYSGYGGVGQGLSSAHSSIGRGGFGGNGMAHGAGA